MKHCVNIPSWGELNHKQINNQELNPIEYFIWEYEPSDSYECFRKDFLNALDFIAIGNRPE